jgi:3-oxoacyl-[acyl-carrier protein] reductase
MNLGLKGKAFIVTGGTAGLGFAAARALSAEGANVIVTAGRRRDSCALANPAPPRRPVASGGHDANFICSHSSVVLRRG